MDERTDSDATPEAAKVKPPAGEPFTEETYRRLAEAQLRYNLAVHEGWQRGQLAWHDAYRKHQGEVQRLELEAQRSCQEVYQDYQRSAEGKGGAEKSQGHWEQLSKVQSDTAGKWQQSQKSLEESLAGVQKELTERMQTAQRDYLRAVREVWSGLQV